MTDKKPCGICHVELPAPDLKKAQDFYTAIFGWKVWPMNDTYMLFSAGDLGGGLDRDMTVADGGATLVLEVEDIDVALEALQAAGGAALSGKTPIGQDRGFYAYFRDPNGNKLGLYSAS